jgi:hypothetical protein
VVGTNFNYGEDITSRGHIKVGSFLLTNKPDFVVKKSFYILKLIGSKFYKKIKRCFRSHLH